MTNSSPQEPTVRDEELARLILGYLREHPGAADTLEGITKWWVMRQRISESTEAVQRALEKLVSEGLIARRRTVDGQSSYSLR